MNAKIRPFVGLGAAVGLVAAALAAETPSATQSAAPTPPPAFTLSRIPPTYPVPYPPASEAEIRAVLERIHGYLEQTSGFTVVDRDTGTTVADLDHPPAHIALVPDEFLLASYEWGVTYAGMLHAAEATGDRRYLDYTAKRLHAIAMVATKGRQEPPAPPDEPPGLPRLLRLRGVIAPRSLDDSGAMAAAMIKASHAGLAPEELRPWIDQYLTWITSGQLRLADGTLARNRPHPHTLWLDDLYMSVPALAQMGALTGETRYFDDAVRQVRQFSQRPSQDAGDDPAQGNWFDT